jgi:hypothetical protein
MKKQTLAGICLPGQSMERLVDLRGGKSTNMAIWPMATSLKLQSSDILAAALSTDTL